MRDSPLDGMLAHHRLPALNLPIPIYTPGWGEVLWENKNTTQCTRSRFELRTLNPKSSTLTRRPPHLPCITPLLSSYMVRFPHGGRILLVKDPYIIIFPFWYPLNSLYVTVIFPLVSLASTQTYALNYIIHLPTNFFRITGVIFFILGGLGFLKKFQSYLKRSRVFQRCLRIGGSVP